MKKLFLLVFVLIFISAKVLAQEAKITGYKPGEFAVKGEIALQLEQNIIEPLSRKLAEAKNSQLEITVIGYADKTGISATNDMLGKNRAEEVKSVLLGKFPGAKIIAITKGDELDSKMVLVRWTIIPSKPVENQAVQKPADKKFFFLGGAFAMVITTVALVIFVAKRKRDKKEVVFKEITKWVEIESVDNKIYSIPVTQKADGKWYSPVPVMGSSGILCREDLGNLYQALKGCVKEKRFAFYNPIFTGLVEKGIIKIKEKKEAVS